MAYSLPWQTTPGYQVPDYSSMYPMPGSYGASSLLQAIPAITYGMQGINTSQQGNIAGQLANVADAQTNIDNPFYKKLYGQYQDQNKQNLAQAISELSAQNRKLSSMGRVPLFNPERGGETLFRGLTQGYQNAGNMAGQQTQSALANSASTLGQAFRGYNSVAQQQFANKQSKAISFNTIGDVVKHLFGL